MLVDLISSHNSLCYLQKKNLQSGFITTSQPVPATGHYFTILAIVVSPTSRKSFVLLRIQYTDTFSGGSLNLTSASAFDYPLINPGLLADDFDMQVMVEAIKASKRFVNASVWDGYIEALYTDAVNTTTDAEIETYLRTYTDSIKHPMGTAGASKASDKSGVVGPELLVKNVQGLRITDASIFVCRFIHNSAIARFL